MGPGIKGVDQNRSKSFSTHRSPSKHHFIMDSLQRFEALSVVMHQICDRISNFLDHSFNADDQLANILDEMNKLRRDWYSNIILCQETASLARPITVGKFESRTTTVDSAKTNPSKVDSFNLLRKFVKSELRCAICTDLMVSATILNCKHSFCYVCITEWEKRTKSCPVCRTSIISQVRSQTIDNLIEMLKSFPKMSKNIEFTEPIQDLVVVAGPGVVETDESRPQAEIEFRTPTTRRSPIIHLSPHRPLPAIDRPTAVQQQHRRPIRSPLPVIARRPTAVQQQHRRPIRPLVAVRHRNPSVVRQQQQRQLAAHSSIHRPAWRY